MFGDKSKGNYGFQIGFTFSKGKDNERFFGEGYGGQYLLMDMADRS